MKLDTNIEDLYRGLDSGTLLALVPVLEAERKRYYDELSQASKTIERAAAGREEDKQMRGMLAGLQEAADRDPRLHPHVQELRAHLDFLEAREQGSIESGERYSFALFLHLNDLMSRRRWVLEELASRGLLPVFPDMSTLVLPGRESAG